MEEDADEEVGSVDERGNFRLYRNLTAEDVGGNIGTIVAAILETSSDGFVSMTTYESNDEARVAWDEIVNDLEG